MTLAEIEAFLILAEELHFGRTAERLFLSQPRVSRLIAALEGEIGGRLFDRTSRRVRITPLGALLREHFPHRRWTAVPDGRGTERHLRCRRLRLQVVTPTARFPTGIDPCPPSG